MFDPGRGVAVLVISERVPRFLAVDFANTVACPSCRAEDAFGRVGSARRWIARTVPDSSVRISTPDLTTIRQFREHLRAVLLASSGGARPSATSLSVVNRAARESPALGVRWFRGRIAPWEETRAPPGSSRLLTAVARSAIDLLVGAEPVPVRPCAGAECVHFVAVRRPSQRWCSPTGCGNRARVQRHYRKIRSTRNPRNKG